MYLCVLFIWIQSSSVCFAYSSWSFRVFPLLNIMLEAYKEATFLSFAGSCCGNCGPLYAKVSSPQYTAFGNQLSRSLGFLIVYGMLLSLNISFIIREDMPLGIWKAQSLAAECFLRECLLSLVCLKVRHSLRCNHYGINVKTSHVVCWFFCKT